MAGSEKALNESVLRRCAYDVLVVPFQVGGYAIDRVDRSLMTRHLAHFLETVTDFEIAKPDTGSASIRRDITNLR